MSILTIRKTEEILNWMNKNSIYLKGQYENHFVLAFFIFSNKLLLPNYLISNGKISKGKIL